MTGDTLIHAGADCLVSIHTPTKGVTYREVFAASFEDSFNPHTHEGCDVCLKVDVLRHQSFNPHTHEGCDTTLFNYSPNFFVSIHTPTKGVTATSGVSRIFYIVSIHTPTKGVTPKTA